MMYLIGLLLLALGLGFEFQSIPIASITGGIGLMVLGILEYLSPTHSDNENG